MASRMVHKTGKGVQVLLGMRVVYVIMCVSDRTQGVDILRCRRRFSGVDVSVAAPHMA